MLIVLYSGLLAALSGSGALLSRTLLPHVRRRVFTDAVLGLSALHALALTGFPLIGVLAIVGLMACGHVGLTLRKSSTLQLPSGIQFRTVALIFASILPLWGYLMIRPLWSFDARNLWFFHGRIIYLAGHFPLQAWQRLICYWGTDYRLNANPDYPKLIGILAASVATLAGYWNEYLPKISILLLSTVELIGFIELGWGLGTVIPILLMTGIPHYRFMFDSAMMDIHVALFMLIAVLAATAHTIKTIPKNEAGSAGTEISDDRVAMAVAALALASQLKYEGRALAVIVILCALLMRTIRLGEFWRVRGVFAAFLPIVMWLAEIRFFHVPSYLGASGGVAVALARLKHEYLTLIVPAILLQPTVLVAAVVVGIALVSVRSILRGTPGAEFRRQTPLLLGLATAAGYGLALSAIYLVTPYADVREHIRSSIYRTTLPIELGLYASALTAVQWARQVRRDVQTG